MITYVVRRLVNVLATTSIVNIQNSPVVATSVPAGRSTTTTLTSAAHSPVTDTDSGSSIPSHLFYLTTHYIPLYTGIVSGRLLPFRLTSLRKPKSIIILTHSAAPYVRQDRGNL